MNNKDKTAIFDFLMDIQKKKGEPEDKADAFLEYLKETSKNETSERLLSRVSQIFNQDITSMYASHAVSQVEVMRYRIDSLEKQFSQLEKKKPEQPVQWLVIQAIAWLISLSAALFGFYMWFKP